MATICSKEINNVWKCFDEMKEISDHFKKYNVVGWLELHK